MLTISAVIAFGLAVWLWGGPQAARVRLAELTREPVGIGRRFGSVASWRPGRGAREAELWRRTSVELCQAIVAELAAGRAPGEALARAVSAVEPPDPLVLLPVAAVARDGGDIPSALLDAAAVPGGEGLRRLATCWRVSVTVGGGLGALVERVGLSLREAEAHRRDVAAQLAGPQTTARLLAGLPLLGVMLGVGLGMKPLAFLLGTSGGLACLVIGLALDGAGVWWTRRMVVRAEAA